MSIYTLSVDLVGNASSNQRDLMNVLFKFPNPDNQFRASIDKGKVLLSQYENLAKNNNDLLTWLDWMSRDRGYFVSVDANITKSMCNEEICLSVASATIPYRKVIVGTHSSWRNFKYEPNSNFIIYNKESIRILDNTEAYQELNTKKELNTFILMPKKNNPWTSGSFYLVTFIILTLAIVASVRYLNNGLYTGLAFIAIVIIFSILGGLQLKNDGQLSEKGFLELMKISISRLTLLRINNKNNEKQDNN